MTKTIEKEICVKKEVVVQVFCDVCGKEITDNYIHVAEHETPHYPDDEYETKDICSPECFSKHVLDVYQDYKENYFGGIFSISIMYWKGE